MKSGSSGILTSEQAIEAFAAEVAYWREVRGLSKKALGKEMGCAPAHVGHMESGRHGPSPDFAHRADGALNAGGAIERRGREYGQAVERESGTGPLLPGSPGPGPDPGPRAGTAPVPPPVERAHPAPYPLAEEPYATGSALVVEHEAARLAYDGDGYRVTTRRLLRNVGSEPITRFLIRISVDRYPGEPERSHAHYRLHPLTWAGLELSAYCDEEPMRLVARHDRGAFKEVWLLFENDRGRFALPPGASVWVEYGYRVSDQQWGQWFQRAVRLPTKRLEVRLAFPRALDPVVWGTETSARARGVPLRTAPCRCDETSGVRVFTWAVTTPPLHARYRLEWCFHGWSADDVRTGAEAAGG